MQVYAIYAPAHHKPGKVQATAAAAVGERNGNYRHGFYTAEAIAERKTTRAWLRSLRS